MPFQPDRITLGLYNNMCDTTHRVYGKHHMEKGDMKTRNIATIAVAVLAGAIAIWNFGTGMFGLISGINVAVLIGVAGIGIGKYLDNKNDEKEGFAVKDELTLMLEGKASIISFKYGNYVWLAILWYEFIANNYVQWPTFEAAEAILLGLLVNLVIYFVSLAHYRNRK